MTGVVAAAVSLSGRRAGTRNRDPESLVREGDLVFQCGRGFYPMLAFVLPGSRGFCHFLADTDSVIGHFHARLARIESQPVADLAPAAGEAAAGLDAMHQAYLIDVRKNSLSVRYAEADEMSTLLEASARDSAASYDGILVPPEDKGLPSLLMDTSPASLEAFLRRCVKQEKFWSRDPEPYRRLKQAPGRGAGRGVNGERPRPAGRAGEPPVGGTCGS